MLAPSIRKNRKVLDIPEPSPSLIMHAFESGDQDAIAGGSTLYPTGSKDCPPVNESSRSPPDLISNTFCPSGDGILASQSATRSLSCLKYEFFDWTQSSACAAIPKTSERASRDLATIWGMSHLM